MAGEPYLLHHLLGQKSQLDSEALIFEKTSIQYPAFHRASRNYADNLFKAGVTAGDRVIIYLPRGLQECFAIFAVSMAGAVFVPVNAMLKPQQVEHILRDSGARAIITNEKMLAVLTSAGVDLAQIHQLICDDIDITHDCTIAPDMRLGEDLAAILYTSGSTGTPKGVMLSHRNLLAGARIVRSYLEITSADRILSLLPFSFDYGLNQLITAVEQGAVTVIKTFRLGDDIVKALVEHSITGLAGVPTILAILTKASPLFKKTALPHLRYITNSGGRVPEATVRALRTLIPDTKIYLMYGLTEAFRSTYLDPLQVDHRPTSIGKAIPECEIFIVKDNGERAKPGEAGILVHHGPTVSLGYWKRPDATAQVLRPHPFVPKEQGGVTVCYSGDLAYEDEDGFFHFVARNDAMIKSSGYRISPTEVEEALMASGLFQQVAVIGLPDTFAGEKVHAVAVPLTETIDTSAVLKSASELLASYMLPRDIELVSHMPVTGNGKVDYKELVKERSTNEH
jgi:acyl-CoA ligase (AMP-forming) (exosortase A-associated)